MTSCNGKYLAWLRNRFGYTQSDIALKLHCTRQAVSDWEKGVNEANYQTLRFLALLYQMSPNIVIHAYHGFQPDGITPLDELNVFPEAAITES